MARAPSSSHALFSLSLKGARLTSASSPAALAPPRQSRPALTDREVFEAMKHDVQAFFRHSLAPSGRRASPTPTFGLTRSVRVGTLLCARHRCVHARARWHAHTRTCFALRVPGDDRPRQHDGKNRQSHKPSEPRTVASVSLPAACVRAYVVCMHVHVRIRMCGCAHPCTPTLTCAPPAFLQTDGLCYPCRVLKVCGFNPSNSSHPGSLLICARILSCFSSTPLPLRPLRRPKMMMMFIVLSRKQS